MTSPDPLTCWTVMPDTLWPSTGVSNLSNVVRENEVGSMSSSRTRKRLMSFSSTNVLRDCSSRIASASTNVWGSEADDMRTGTDFVKTREFPVLVEEWREVVSCHWEPGAPVAGEDP